MSYAIAWRTCPKLLGRADLGETELLNDLIILRELTGFLKGVNGEYVDIRLLFSIT
jgi:hypothetical protein